MRVSSDGRLNLAKSTLRQVSRSQPRVLSAARFVFTNEAMYSRRYWFAASFILVATVADARRIDSRVSSASDDIAPTSARMRSTYSKGIVALPLSKAIIVAPVVDVTVHSA